MQKTNGQMFLNVFIFVKNKIINSSIWTISVEQIKNVGSSIMRKNKGQYYKFSLPFFPSIREKSGIA